MRHEFSNETCRHCGCARAQVDIVPRCECMPHVGNHWHLLGRDEAPAEPSELVDASNWSERARFARAMPVTVSRHAVEAYP